MKNITIIFRMTSACNLNCTYCYDKANHIMKKEENKKFKLKIPNIVKNIEKLWENKDAKGEIIFHGGEPLIIDEENYEVLIKNIKSIYPKARFSIQTNGTLINEKYISLFKKYNVHVGISLDGYNEITNKYRVYGNQKNSFNDVMKKISLLNKYGVKFGVIMTLNNSVVGNEEKLYKFIGDNKLNCNIRPAFKSDNKEIEYMSNEEYYIFFKKLFNIWINDKKKEVKLTQIKEIYDEFVKVLEPLYNNKSCSTSGNCYRNFISLDSEGELYSCNRTYHNNDFYYGNINKMDKKQLNSKIEERLKKRKQIIENSKCKLCKLFSECHGGCPANGYSLYGDINSSDDNFCNAKLKIREYVTDYIEKNNIKKDYLEMKANV